MNTALTTNEGKDKHVNIVCIQDENGDWNPYLEADNIPVPNCSFNGVKGLLASGWLDLHTDGDAYENADRYQVITPFYILDESVTLLVTVNDKLVEQKLRVGESFIVDLLSPHALLPRRFAERIVAEGSLNFEEFTNWYEDLYSSNGMAPVFAWHTEAYKN